MAISERSRPSNPASTLQRELILRAIMQTAKSFLRADSWEAAMREVLQGLDDATGADPTLMASAIERDRGNRENLEARAKYQALVEQIPAAVYVARNEETFPCMYMSPQTEALVGFTAQEVLDDPTLWEQQMHPADKEGAVESFVEGILKGDAELRRLHDRTVRAAEAERMRIARDLHDGPVQRLTRLNLLFERVHIRLERGDSTGATAILNQASTSLGEEIARLRRMMTELRPPVLDQRGLADAIRDHAEELGRSSGLVCTIEVGSVERLGGNLETALYRITQEALANVVKHAEASHASITTFEDGGSVVLEVVDDGRGSDPKTVAQGRGERYGLLGMRERMEMLGGTLDVASVRGEGTRVRATVPKP